MSDDPDEAAPPEARETRVAWDLALTPEQSRSVDRSARWMAWLGRFQVLAGGLISLFVLVGALIWALGQSPTTEVDSSTTPPLVRLGAVSTETLATSGAVILAFGLLLLRGGVLLNDAADDLEHHASGRFVEAGLGHLAGYFVTEIALVGVTIAVVLGLGALQ